MHNKNQRGKKMSGSRKDAYVEAKVMSFITGCKRPDSDLTVKKAPKYMKQLVFNMNCFWQKGDKRLAELKKEQEKNPFTNTFEIDQQDYRQNRTRLYLVDGTRRIGEQFGAAKAPRFRAEYIEHQMDKEENLRLLRAGEAIMGMNTKKK